DAVQDAQAARDAGLDGHRPAYRDPPLPFAGRQPAALRIRAQFEGDRFLGDRRSARAVLLPDRGAAARSVESVFAGAGKDRAVCERAGRAAATRETDDACGVPRATRREEYLAASYLALSHRGSERGRSTKNRADL